MFSCICSPDSSGPSVCEERNVVARKQYRCCECHSVISKGEAYEYVRGLWDGYWITYRTCRVCASIRRDFMSCGYTYEMLWEDLRDANDDGDTDWLD